MKDCCLVPTRKTYQKVFRQCDFCEAVWLPTKEGPAYLREPWDDAPISEEVLAEFTKLAAELEETIPVD